MLLMLVDTQPNESAGIIHFLYGPLFIVTTRCDLRSTGFEPITLPVSPLYILKHKSPE